jgi:signal transduction histidine kinase
MRNVEEVFSALKENLDQILGNLQDGILLFTGDGRAVLVSEAARRFLDIERGSILGQHAREIFDPRRCWADPARGLRCRRARWCRKRFAPRPAPHPGLAGFYPRRTHKQGWARWSRCTIWNRCEEIESELELSRRMAAIGRLTSGVGHEVKNPINAIVVHLELAEDQAGRRQRPGGAPPGGHRRGDSSLDRVVQTLVDFSRPVELATARTGPAHGDRRRAGAGRRGVVHAQRDLVSQHAVQPLVANVDADLLKQAVLNVIQNGAQAMPEGGKLEVVLEEDRRAPFCASPMKAPAFPTRFGRRSSTSTSPPRARAAASVWP